MCGIFCQKKEGKPVLLPSVASKALKTVTSKCNPEDRLCRSNEKGYYPKTMAHSLFIPLASEYQAERNEARNSAIEESTLI